MTIKKIKIKKGFTLLEIIMLMIVVGVLTALALPKFFSIIEFSRSTEAFDSLNVLRNSMQRCYLSTQDYVNCSNIAFTV